MARCLPGLDQPLWFPNGDPLPGAVYAACGLLLIAAIAAPWVPRRGIAVSLALTTALSFGLLAYLGPHFRFGVALYVVPPLALAAAVAKEPTRPPLCWLWIPASAFAASTLSFIRLSLMDRSPQASWIAVPAATVIACGLACAVVLWLAVDARPFIAVVMVFEWLIQPDFAYPGLSGGLIFIGRDAVLLLVPLWLAGLAIGLLRRKVAQCNNPRPVILAGVTA
ncbi:MAG: hypothetical protein ACR2FU_23055 [Streptosporangiaceae bacterium]